MGPSITGVVTWCVAGRDMNPPDIPEGLCLRVELGDAHDYDLTIDGPARRIAWSAWRAKTVQVVGSNSRAVAWFMAEVERAIEHQVADDEREDQEHRERFPFGDPGPGFPSYDARDILG